MSGFNEKIHMRGKVEEDIYFAKLNQKLLDVLHDKMAQKTNKESTQCEQPANASKNIPK
ncbi:MAG: hypothetical protein ACJAZP_000873 [Psychromonas sp.]|jgi:hypothetical protein|uniref:hypothetical protein n=1 Tax=Psychromonas sp. TaxID=1884585 RepID=UPI0039E32113